MTPHTSKPSFDRLINLVKYYPMLWKTAESNDCGRITQGAEELFVMASEAKYLQPNARVASDYYRIYHELDLSNRHAIA